MCRMLAYKGEDKEELKGFLECLVRAAEKDPITGDVHGDGWGIIAYTTSGTLIHYRSSLPIFKDKKVFDLISFLEGKMWVIVHARLASQKELVDARFSHPYLETTPNELIYIAHNGSVDKELLGKEMGLDPKLMVDSELIGKFIAREGISRLDRLKEYTKSALNLFILRIPRDKSSPPSLYYFNYYNEDYVKKKGIPSEYYKFYKKGNAVFSSSLAYFCGKDSDVAYGVIGEL